MADNHGQVSRVKTATYNQNLPDYTQKANCYDVIINQLILHQGKITVSRRSQNQFIMLINPRTGWRKKRNPLPATYCGLPLDAPTLKGLVKNRPKGKQWQTVPFSHCDIKIHWVKETGKLMAAQYSFILSIYHYQGETRLDHFRTLYKSRSSTVVLSTGQVNKFTQLWRLIYLDAWVKDVID